MTYYKINQVIKLLNVEKESKVQIWEEKCKGTVRQGNLSVCLWAFWNPKRREMHLDMLPERKKLARTLKMVDTYFSSDFGIQIWHL